MTTLITNIKTLLQTGFEAGIRQTVKGNAMKEVAQIDNAWLLIEGEEIKDFGSMDQLPEIHADQMMDATGRLVLPAWCDSHTHLVYAGSREQEFVDRINGLAYEEIARRGGGILNSAKKVNAASEAQLFDETMLRLHEISALGTGAVEIKSGYALSTEGEMKMLRVVRKIKEHTKIDIKATFLGAHAYPLEYKQNHQGYIDLLVNEMIPKIAGEGLADYVDAFCEEGFFNVAETSQVMEAGLKYGLKPKIHANQLHRSGGIQVGVKYGALSVDHLEFVEEEELACLLGSETMPTLLPSAAFFIRLPYQPARKMIDAGLPIALASDYNPGTSPSGNIPFLMSLGCTQLRMTPEECLHAVTMNSAYAMDLSETHGSIARGKKANLIITDKIPSLAFIPYSFGSNLIHKVMVKGEWI